jgi:DHA2 family multidrug resistance protein-like MFS transporter
VFGSVATAVYRNELTVPDGLPAGAAAEATESLAGAVNVAGGLGDQLAASLIVPAREAFTSGLHTVAAIAAVVVVAFAVIGMVALRNGRPAGAEAEPATEDEAELIAAR